MKTLIALALLLLSSPVIAAPPETGTFNDPASEIKEGIFVTTSSSTKRTFSFFTTLHDCDIVKESLECYSHQLWLIADLRSVTLGESIGVASTVIDGDTVTVGTYFLNETGTGYTLFIVHSGSSPFDPDTQIYDHLYDFNTCIVSPDPACGVVP
jgi:hypothetical protein